MLHVTDENLLAAVLYLRPRWHDVCPQFRAGLGRMFLGWALRKFQPGYKRR